MPNTVLIPSGSGQTGTSIGSRLVTMVARIVGGESEGMIRTQATDCLNRARIELNHHELEFMKRTDDPITLVNGTDTYSLDAAFIKPSYAQLITADARPFVDLDYYDDHAFAHLQGNQQDSRGLPVCYRLRNDFEDGLVSLYPIPDSSSATNYRLLVEYYARIPVIADDDTSPNLPEEVENVLVIGGQAYLLREREKTSPAGNIAFADYQRAKTLLITHSRRCSEEMPRFRLKLTRPRFDPTIYIRIR